MQPIFEFAEAERRATIEKLTPTQKKLLLALTDEYQLPAQIAKAAGMRDSTDSDGNARRELANLERMRLAEGEPYAGYRRHDNVRTQTAE